MSDTGKNNAVSRAALIMVVLLTVLAVISGIGAVRNALRYSQDFQYDAARALMRGVDPYEMSFLSRNGVSDEWNEGVRRAGLEPFYEYFESIDAPQKMEANQFPSLLYLLEPFAALPFKAARVCWTICNLLFSAAIIFLLKKTFLRAVDDRVFTLLSLVMLSGTPWRNQVGVGQHTLFSFAFFLLAVWLSELAEIVIVSGDERYAKGDTRKLTALSGLALCVSYFKYTLTVPLALYFVYKRRWRELVISVIPHIIGTAAAAFALGTPVIDMIIKPLKVSMALSGEGSLDIGAMLGGGSKAVIASLIIMLFMTVLSMVFPQGEDEIFFSIVLMLSLIFTYHRTYDFFVLTAQFGGVSAIAGLSKKPLRTALYVFYAVLIMVIFFGLRVFHESYGAVIAAAVIYYCFIVFFTAAGFKKVWTSFTS